MPAFFAYENWVHDYVNVHHDDCHMINDPRRERALTNDIGPNDAWHNLGEQESETSALREAARRRHRAHAAPRMCMYCREGGGLETTAGFGGAGRVVCTFPCF